MEEPGFKVEVPVMGPVTLVLSRWVISIFVPLNLQVSYVGQSCREIPEHLGRDFGHFAKRLDLSFNLLRYANFERCHPGLGHPVPSRTLVQQAQAIGPSSLQDLEKDETTHQTLLQTILEIMHLEIMAGL